MRACPVLLAPLTHCSAVCSYHVGGGPSSYKQAGFSGLVQRLVTLSCSKGRGRVGQTTQVGGHGRRSWQCWEEEAEDKGLFKANAVNEEDPERDRATQA